MKKDKLNSLSLLAIETELVNIDFDDFEAQKTHRNHWVCDHILTFSVN